MTYCLEIEEWKYCSHENLSIMEFNSMVSFLLMIRLNLANQIIYLVKGSPHGGIPVMGTHARNFIIDSTHDLVTYQGILLCDWLILEFYTLVGELWNYINIYMVFRILPLEVKLLILLHSFMTALDMVIYIFHNTSWKMFVVL
jgi:hypothetical protein